MTNQILSEEFRRMQKLAGIVTESQLNEALNKDIKAFGQDLDKNLKAAGFQTLILVGKSVSDEQKEKFFTLVKGIQTELAERMKIKEAELSGGQHKLDIDKDGDIGGDDLAKLRSKNESKKRK